ncbi:MAG: EscU/YscU/HrcU family type III secretion system export apparatus switch protein [Bdellovibrionales bacterium]|nr:EscU/YscU/HrcU family type III secretion system export apparatus switch protein [Bdellovibrionales bacterium]
MTDKTPPPAPKAAIALVYDQRTAPRITAKGEQEIAEEIIRIAREHNVPLYENAELVKALSTLDLGAEIPELLYRIVAEVIAFAFYLKGKTPEGFEP